MFAGAELIGRMAMNLIDVTRSEDGTLQPSLVELDLQALLEEVVELMAPLAEGRKQRLELETVLAGVVLRGDRDLLRRVLQNLLDNALRYNTSDTVRVHAEPLDGGTVEIRILDEGRGVPEDQRERIFDKYARLDQDGDHRASGGHGLGLAFCRVAIEAHGGSIRVEPNQPQGSVFVTRLPAG